MRLDQHAHPAGGRDAPRWLPAFGVWQGSVGVRLRGLHEDQARHDGAGRLSQVGPKVSTTPDEVPQQRRLLTEIPGPRSRELAARRDRAIPRGVSTTLPVFVVRAGPGILEDVDGNRLIDFGSGISTTNAGNSAPLVVEAIWEQSALFTHTCFQVTPYAGYVEVCEHLNELTPGDHEKRSFLVNSGAEAIENVVKVARYATGRPGIVAFDHGFHGRTQLTMTLTGKEMPYKHGFGPFAPEVHRAPYSYPFRGTGRLADTITMLETSVGAESIAAVLVEPIAGEGGVVVPEAGWIARLGRWGRGAAHRWVAGPRRGDGLGPPRGRRRDLRGQPGLLRRLPGRDPHHRDRGSHRASPAHRRGGAAPAAQALRHPTRGRGGARPGRDGGHRVRPGRRDHA